ncbi:MAG: DUF362 domain-containing protein [Desulfobacterium sp.]|nr:DUF362 domain-containing protein [Desulfobacterium sp.]MBU3947388.1 DUF362 domain-containing protein [Pseudomonadota bacterium]MBU4009912.1 DUF362 domain-containing protein [Pseudomonadota bacterium]MBU4035572.1 DUF362 domain-containing protein [Pseudomonadota bacterium]
MSDKNIDKETSRREFIIRSSKAGLLILSSGFVGGFFYNRNDSVSSVKTESITALPDFSIKDKAGKMAIVKGDDRVKTINLALKAMGGIETFIKKGDRVLLKVNAAFASPPVISATTNPELLKEVIRLCYSAGALSVVVTDNPINDPMSCFSLTGIESAAKSCGAKIILPDESLFTQISIEGGNLIKDWPVLYKPLINADKLIGIAPLKDHHRSGASMTMKNWYGLLGGRRNIFHQDINNIIKELAIMVKPTLVILDGTTTMMSNGPTGGSLSDLKQTNVMIAGTDQVAVDAFGATLLGTRAQELAYIEKAYAAGVGNMDYRLLNPEMIISL